MAFPDHTQELPKGDIPDCDMSTFMELVKRMPSKKLGIKAYAQYKGKTYFIHFNPDTGEDELWRVDAEWL